MKWLDRFRPELPVTEFVAEAIDDLRAAGVASPEQDAWLLLEHASGMTRTQLLALREDCPGSVPGLDSFVDDLVPRRVAREPLQHITGIAYFRYLELAVGPGVFIPRPETELVAQAAIDFARTLDAPLVVDLCAGSGAIALSIGSEVPRATVHAVELDDAAMPWLRRNAKGTDVQVHQGAAASALAGLDGAVDVVASNPPYLPLSSRNGMQTEARDHDPSPALWGGVDGLETIRDVVRRATALLRDGGLLVVEHDDTHGGVVPEMLAASGDWRDIAGHEDLTGRPRFATATRASR